MAKGNREKSEAQVIIKDAATYKQMRDEIVDLRVISISAIVEKYKVTGTIARRIIRELIKDGQIKPVVHHRHQLIYVPATSE